jgi:hypothetical protein
LQKLTPLAFNSIEKLHLRKYFTSEELFLQFKQYDPELSKSTFRWRVYDLKRKDKIRDVMWGVYSLSDKPYFKPIIPENAKKIADVFSKKYPELTYCIWSSEWLNDWTIHQTVKHFIILETESDVIEDTFYFFKGKGIEVFLQPDKNTMDKYVLQAKEPVVIMSLITRAPVLLIEKIVIPSIEKILVDVFCDKETFFLFTGSELQNIFRFALRKYAINYSRLFSYADRRTRKEEIRQFIIEQADDSLKELLNDKH